MTFGHLLRFQLCSFPPSSATRGPRIQGLTSRLDGVASSAKVWIAFRKFSRVFLTSTICQAIFHDALYRLNCSIHAGENNCSQACRQAAQHENAQQLGKTQAEENCWWNPAGDYSQKSVYNVTWMALPTKLDTSSRTDSNVSSSNWNHRLKVTKR